MSSVVIVNTGLCNIDSIARAIEECGGGRPVVTEDPRDLGRASRVVLPGVGAYPEAMERLTSCGLADAMREQVFGHGIPFLGVCLGMQLLATRGHENGIVEGLGWIDGEVERIVPTAGERVPHIGWNQVDAVGRATLLRSGQPGRDYYFVHSYVLQPVNAEDVAATTPYGGGFCSAVERGNIFGVQFHPEKSQRAGFDVLRAFLAV